MFLPQQPPTSLSLYLWLLGNLPPMVDTVLEPISEEFLSFDELLYMYFKK